MHFASVSAVVLFGHLPPLTLGAGVVDGRVNSIGHAACVLGHDRTARRSSLSTSTASTIRRPRVVRGQSRSGQHVRLRDGQS